MAGFSSAPNGMDDRLHSAYPTSRLLGALRLSPPGSSYEQYLIQKLLERGVSPQDIQGRMGAMGVPPDARDQDLSAPTLAPTSPYVMPLPEPQSEPQGIAALDPRRAQMQANADALKGKVSERQKYLAGLESLKKRPVPDFNQGAFKVPGSAPDLSFDNSLAEDRDYGPGPVPVPGEKPAPWDTPIPGVKPPQYVEGTYSRGMPQAPGMDDVGGPWSSDTDYGPGPVPIPGEKPGDGAPIPGVKPEYQDTPPIPGEKPVAWDTPIPGVKPKPPPGQPPVAGLSSNLAGKVNGYQPNIPNTPVLDNVRTAAVPIPQEKPKVPVTADEGSGGILEALPAGVGDTSDAPPGAAKSLETKGITTEGAKTNDMSVGSGLEKWMPLIAAGLGMMSSKSNQFLGALGEGGLTGLKTMMEQRKADREDRHQAGIDQYYKDRIDVERQQAAATEAWRKAQEKNADKPKWGVHESGPNLVAYNLADPSQTRVIGPAPLWRHGAQTGGGDHGTVMERNIANLARIYGVDERTAHQIMTAPKSLTDQRLMQMARSSAFKKVPKSRLDPTTVADAAEYDRVTREEYDALKGLTGAYAAALAAPGAAPPAPSSKEQKDPAGILGDNDPLGLRQ